MPSSSFYTDGGVYDTAEVVSNDTASSTEATPAPSSMYPNGNIYDALSDSDTVVANMAALAAATLADKLAADASASSAHTSDVNAATSLAGLLASGATAAPLMDGVAAVGAATKWAREDHVHPTDTSRAALTYVDAQDALKAPLASPALTGTPTSPTAAAGTNTTQLANTAFVQAAITALIGGAPGALDTLKELADAINDDASYAATITAALALKAPLASPTLTGTPAAPTAAADTNTTQLATTAFVIGQAGASTPLIDGTAAVGTSKKYSREDHVHPTDTTRAPLASPTFTGTPAGPTATAGTNTTQLATTAFVAANPVAASQLSNNTRYTTVSFVIDGGGSAITTGVKGDLEIPYGGVIDRVTVLGDQSGSIVIDIWKDTYANYPPTVADTITASAKPTLSSATKSQDATLTGWTTTITAGDTLRYNVDSATTVTRVLVSLRILKS
jgi:hypothetical protein